MIIDALSKFCENEEVDTGAAGYYQLGSTIDLGLAPGDIGGGQPLYLVITATQGISVASSTGEVEFHLASDAAASFTAATATLHVGVVLNTSTTAIPAGSVLLCVPVPSEGVEVYERYLGIVQRTSTTAINAGYINAFLTPTPQKWKALADGIPTPV